MNGDRPYYFGNAKADDVRGSGWFVGQFVAPELGARRQTDVELKWGVHPAGEKRSRPWAAGHGTTISVLVEGRLKITFHVAGTQEEATQEEVTLATQGDYVIFGPETVHSWEAIDEAIVLTVRFPSVEARATAPAAAAALRDGGA